jgi:hypothetical protein
LQPEFNLKNGHAKDPAADPNQGELSGPGGVQYQKLDAGMISVLDQQLPRRLLF